MATPKPLADYLLGSLYKPWKENRKPLEDKWQGNWELFRGIMSGKWKAFEGESYRSNTNLNSTRQKVMAAFAIIIQQVVRGGRIVYGVNPDTGNPWLKSMLGPDANAIMEQDAAKMKQLSDETLSKCDAERALARNTLAMAVYGETFAKEVTATYPTTKHRPVLPDGVTDIAGVDPASVMWEPYTEETDGFCWVAVSPWEIVRDMQSDDLQACHGIFHERPVSPYFLRGKIKAGFDKDAIDRVLKAAHNKVKGADADDTNTMIPGMKRLQNRGNSIRYREYHGRVPVALAEWAASAKAATDANPLIPSAEDLSNGDEIECFAVLADEEVVFFELVEPNKRPFERAVWEDALDDIGGHGIADSVADVHIAMTGAFRAYEDGAKAASALILVLRESLITKPEDISKGIQAGFLKLELEAGPTSLTDAVQQLKIVNPAENVIGLIEQLKNFLEEESLVPRISSGLAVKGDEATAYEINQRVERSSTYTGMVIRNIDEGLTEPMVQRVIDRLQGDPDFEGPRGDFRIEAQGFSGFEARNTRIAAIYKLLELSMQDEDIRRRRKLQPILDEIATTMDVSPSDYWHTDEEMQEIDERVAAQAQALAMKADPTQESKINRDTAAADKDRASIEIERERLQLDKAKGIAEIEAKMREPVEKAGGAGGNAKNAKGSDEKRAAA